MLTVYQEFALLLFVSAVAGLLALRLRQPLIVAYIVVGIAVGPAMLGWVTAHDQVDLLAQIGITVLLFVVGLKLDLHLVRHLGTVALATGLGQLAFTIVIGFFITMGLGMDMMTALYVAVALTFSSTIIIVKLLSDKREIDTLHGRIAMGFLIVQDIAVVLAMMAVGTQGAGGGDWVQTLLIVAGKVALAGAAIALMMRYVLPRLLHWMAFSQELLLLFAVAWGTGLATLGEVLGFSKEVGAFLAGFSLASSHYREAISGRLTSLRDFLLLFFFIDLGAKLEFATLGAEIPAAIVLSLFVLIGNPLIVMAIMGYMGYRKRTGFLAGLTVAQISEFSIVFVAMGIQLGHVGRETLGLVTLVGLVTITLSTYMILYSHRLYDWLAPWLGVFERRHAKQEHKHGMDEMMAPEVILLGVGRYGRRLGERLTELGIHVLGVDVDPQSFQHSGKVPFPVRFGDAEDIASLVSMPFMQARWIISTVPQVDINRGLLKNLRQHGYRGNIILTARSEEDIARLQHAGADRVLTPFTDAADHAAEALASETQRRD